MCGGAGQGKPAGRGGAGQLTDAADDVADSPPDSSYNPNKRVHFRSTST